MVPSAVGGSADGLLRANVVLGRMECDFSLEEHARYQRGIIEALESVGARTGADVMWLDHALCANSRCRTATDSGASIYKDGGHLSIPGAIWLVPQLGIERLIDAHDKVDAPSVRNQ